MSVFYFHHVKTEFQVADKQAAAVGGRVLPELHGGREDRGRVLQHGGGADVQRERPHSYHR